MSQRDSGYERKERDLYETPEWVTDALLPHLPPPPLQVWEPACGTGKMVLPLEAAGYDVDGSDIFDGYDFLKSDNKTYQAIITNPPYVLATEFIGHALGLCGVPGDTRLVAMLLRTDFDHAKTRQHLFSGCPAFAKKLVLTKRIKWFADSTGSPSFNHAWYLWDWQHKGPPTLAYGP